MEDAIQTAIENTLNRMRANMNPDEAMKLSQAALNLSHAAVNLNAVYKKTTKGAGS